MCYVQCESRMSQQTKITPSSESVSPPPQSTTWRIDLKSYRQQDFDNDFMDERSREAHVEPPSQTDTMSAEAVDVTLDSSLNVRFDNQTTASPVVLTPEVMVTDADGQPAPPAKMAKQHKQPLRSVSSEMIEAYLDEYNQQNLQLEDKVDASEPLAKQNTNRPDNVQWKQQKLPAWQPIYRPLNIICTFIAMGIVLLGLGSWMLLSTLGTQEYVYDYTDCRSVQHKNYTCAEELAKGWVYPPNCQCEVIVTIEKDIPAPVFLYYSLEGFYQNHRRYVSSVDYRQLIGRTDLTLDSIRSHCKPYSDIDGRIIGPCGAVANSFFTDSFVMKQNFGKEFEIEIGERDIAWPTDKAYKFKNAPRENMDKLEQPINWTMKVTELDLKDWSNNGYQNEHFIVWMRTAAFSTFRKLWGNLDVSSIVEGQKKGSLPKGDYKFIIDYNYRTVFGKLRIPKKLIVSNTSWLGGRNLFLPYLYLATGCVCLLLGFFFLIFIRNAAKKSKPACETEYGSILNTNPKSFANQNYRDNVLRSKLHHENDGDDMIQPIQD